MGRLPLTIMKRTVEQIQYDISTQTKKCCSCQERKPFSEYTKRKANIDGINNRCKFCSHSYDNSRYKDKGFNKDYYLKHMYGITLSEYEDLHRQQDGKCKICSTDCCTTGRELAVDHDHKTGKVRGLLCKDCNTALGGFKDNRVLLFKAAQYLEESRYEK